MYSGLNTSLITLWLSSTKLFLLRRLAGSTTSEKPVKMSEDVPDLASSSESEVEENVASNKPKNDVAEEEKSCTHSTSNGLPRSLSVRDLMAKVEESKMARKAQNSGDESESSTDLDDDEDDDEDDDDEDGIEGEDIVAQPENAENRCSTEVEDAGSKSISLQQKQEEKFLSCLQQATMAFTSGNYLSAASEYKLALMMLTNNKFESGHNDRHIIRYCLGLSHINQKYNKEIREGERVFQSIVEADESTVRVLGYLGLAKAYLKQNRFSEAIQPLQDGIALISDGVSPGRCLWPGTSNVIAETDNSPADLKELFEQLLSDCRNPPLPLAVCRYSKCYDPVKSQMYLSDPEFKGYVQVVCIEKCVMEYHRECWREMKSKELDKRSDKELLADSCITPDCQSTVCKIMVFGPDGKSLKSLNIEENASKSKKAGSKFKNVSVKVPAQKKVGGKKAKGVTAVEEKAKAVEVDDSAENKVRAGETVRHRDDTRTDTRTHRDDTRTDTRTHEGGGGGGDWGKGGRSNRRRKSTDAEDGRRGPESEKGVDPLVTMKRTDFVTLQKKKNEEQDPENLSKKGKKKREKEKPKKTTICVDFVDERRKTNMEALELAYEQEPEPNHSLWTIPPVGAYDDIPGSNWLMPQSNGVTGFATIEPRSNRQQQSEDIWDLRTGTIISRSEADNDSEVSRNASAAKDSQPEEVEEDVKGNIMSYFEMFLEKNGPCLTDDDLIQQELEAFPGNAQVVISEAGGLANLLLQSVKFTVVDGYICLLKDAVKGRQKARERRMAMLSGSNFFKKFSGGLPTSKTKSSTVDTVTSSGGNTVSATVVPEPEEGKNSSSISATAKKSDELISRAVSAAPCPKSDSVYTNETLSASNETVANSSLQKPVVLAAGAESAVILNDIKPNVKDTDNLFGLCDLNEYKNQLRQKIASLPVEEKYDGLDSFDVEGDGTLSVIEKFKKQVHEAASKERNRARLAQTTTSSLVSANATSDYSAKSPVGDSKYAASGGVFGNLSSTTAVKFGSFLFTGNDVKIENDKKFKRAVEPTGKSLEQPLGVSSLLDIEDDVWNEKGAVSVNKTTKSDASLFSFSGNGENGFKTSNTSLKNSSTVKSTLSATARNFQFPFSTTGFTTSTVSSGAAQKVNPSTTDTSGSRTVHGLHMNSLGYEFGNDSASMNNTGSTLSGVGHENELIKSGSAIFEVFGSRHRDHNGLWVEDRAMNTDENLSAFGDYDRLKSEHDDLSRKYKSLAEKQLQIQNRHTEELRIVTDKLYRANEQLENAEKKAWQMENDSQQWKREKMIYETELEKLRSDLNYTKISLDSANHLVEVTNRLLSETKNGLMSEQEECRSVRDKYESLLNQLGRAVRGKAESPFAQPSSGSPIAAVPVTADPAGRAGNRKPKHGFEKILNMLALEFPNLSRIEMSRCVQEVRMSRNNSLSGLTVQEIVAKVREFILKEQTSKQQLKKKNALDLPYSMPNMVKYNINNNGTFGGEVFTEEIDPCIICHEELSTEAASMLDCGHSFHTECVRKWFREQSTCPTCRNHALLPDEFPALGRTFFT